MAKDDFHENAATAELVAWRRDWNGCREADRQQRGGDVEVMRQALERISGLRGTAGFERTSFTNEVQVFANEIARAALAAQSVEKDSGDSK